LPLSFGTRRFKQWWFTDYYWDRFDALNMAGQLFAWKCVRDGT
jgi:hypothetical protein